MAVIKKKMQMGGKAKAALASKGKPMGPEIGAYSKLRGKDLELEKKTNLKFGDGPGSGPSGAMPQPKKKMGGKVMKKAQDGSSLGMKSVKAGYDNNSGVTRADFVSIGKGEAKSGAALKKQAAVAIAMKKAGKAPKGMKSGGSMKKCKYGCK